MDKRCVRRYWKDVISRSFRSAWKKVEIKAAIIATCSILVSIAVLGLLTLIGIIPLHIFTDQAKNAVSGLLSFCGSIIVLFFLFLMMIYRTPAEMNYKKDQAIKRLQKKFKEHPELEKLAQLRTSGVALRNSGEQLKDINALTMWIEGYRVWDKNVLDMLGRLSKAKSEWLRTLNRMPQYRFQNILNDEHALYLNIFEEKLKRLESILESYLNLPGF